jgi:hypothetical protein
MPCSWQKAFAISSADSPACKEQASSQIKFVTSLPIMNLFSVFIATKIVLSSAVLLDCSCKSPSYRLFAKVKPRSVRLTHHKLGALCYVRLFITFLSFHILNLNLATILPSC